MNKRGVLSIAPYYGGKSRMAHFIADRLNYDDSDIFVTPVTIYLPLGSWQPAIGMGHLIAKAVE